MAERVGTDPRRAGAHAADWSAKLLVLLREQRECGRRLEVATARQTAAVREGRTDDVLAALAERQGWIDRMLEIGAAASPLRDEWERGARDLSPAQREEIARLAGEVEGLVRSVAERDEADRLELERQRGEVSSRIAGVARGASGVSAYRVAGAGPAMQDRRA